jgi:hypothetical protein
MRRLIFQVDVGKPSDLTSLNGGPSKLYQFCQDSVARYCKKHNIDHHIQTEPMLKILPDPKTTNRSEGSIRLGYLPIYEKEHAFTFFDRYEQIAIIDSDIYIRDNAPNIFDAIDIHSSFGGVIEREMPITPKYAHKIYHYSNSQYANLPTDHKPNKFGYEFYNMGMMVMNKSIVEHLNGLSPRDFIMQKEFKPFVDGQGAWKWSTDQTLLNYWVRKSGMNLDRMSWKWNGLFKGIQDEYFKQAHFLHFFLKDNLPEKGENIEKLKLIVEGKLNLDFQHV